MKPTYSARNLFLVGSTMAFTIFFQGCKNEPKQVIKTTVNETVLTAPDGFSVEEIGKDLGAVRHLTVAQNGDIYANRSVLKEGKAIIVLKDTDMDGSIDTQESFADVPGTGILVKDDYLYTSSNSGVYRYTMNKDHEVVDTDNPEKIVEGLLDMGADNAKPFTIDGDDNLYVTIGSWNDACRNNDAGAGMIPCTLLDSAGGIWKFKADALNQTYGDGSRYVTGIKNAVGITWNFKTNSLFATDHGRGGLHSFYPDLYSQTQDGDLPAETLYQLKQGDNAGWPATYYDPFKKKRILAPEYGGDGEKTGGEDAVMPIMAFPAHLGPNDLLFYTGDMFPEKYKHGAFIAFHNQSPALKEGFFVAFVPFKDGKPSGDWEVFLDNFAGFDLTDPEGGTLQHRPCGLAQGPDGALYVCDDFGGSIFKITY